MPWLPTDSDSVGCFRGLEGSQGEVMETSTSHLGTTLFCVDDGVLLAFKSHNLECTGVVYSSVGSRGGSAPLRLQKDRKRVECSLWAADQSLPEIVVYASVLFYKWCWAGARERLGSHIRQCWWCLVFHYEERAHPKKLLI